MLLLLLYYFKAIRLLLDAKYNKITFKKLIIIFFFYVQNCRDIKTVLQYTST